MSGENGAPALTAANVRDALRVRYPATQRMGVRTIPGPWTCIEEWSRIDLLAVCATSASGKICGVPQARVGHEIKVSRADYRAELRNPEKRRAARESCHAFYFVVPDGLLRPDELGATQTALTLEAPLFVPDDVGLIIVGRGGCRVAVKSPVIREPRPIVDSPFQAGDGWGATLHALIRWVSARPDPRHAGLVDQARERSREIRAVARQR